MPQRFEISGSEHLYPGRKWYHSKIFKFVAWFLVILIVLFSIMVGVEINRMRNSENNEQNLENNESSADKPNLALELSTADDPRGGSTLGKIKIVEFGNFLCSSCRTSHHVVNRILNEYKDDIDFVFRDFAFVFGEESYSVRLAEASECAKEQGFFWELHDFIFERQEMMSEEMLLSGVNNLVADGLDLDRFTYCYENRDYKSEVEKDWQAGIDAGVTATPTFFINDRKIEGAIPYDDLRQIVEYYLTEERN